MTDPDPARERLLAEYERRTGARPRWLDELTNAGLAWHLEQMKSPLP